MGRGRRLEPQLRNLTRTVKHAGNKGVLRDGDCQWMTAASGIEHNEGTGHPGGMLHGFQCWINLPAARKMDPPAYKELRYVKNKGRYGRYQHGPSG